jgi:alginate O-acetyltransferase complex protein AlgI
MLFVEARFFYFFLLVFAVHWSLRGNTLRKVWLLLCSYFFYAAFFVGPEPFSGKPLPQGWWFPLLLMASTGMDYLVGLRLGGERRESSRKLWMTASICVNIGVLVYFKYMGFFVESAVAFTTWLGLPASYHTLKIILPVGVSFYTFQSMSYTIEVYRRHRPPERDFLNLATFIAFFPQLVAGPIVRAAHILPQFAATRRWADVDVRGALVLFMVGFVKKACVSDNIAPFVDRYFADPTHFTAWSAWIAVPLYAVQIYCDFSGYTDMAIACARLLGYDLAINFNFPYFSQNVTEFWKRWHISLSTWLRDYLYISLGGNRGTKAFVYRNLLLTMLLGGLWHGSRWTFVAWGALHGLALVGHREWINLRARWSLGEPGAVGKAAATALTFYFVCVCWIFFRSADLSKPMTGDDFARALHIVRAFAGFGPQGGGELQCLDPRLFAVLIGLAGVHWCNFKNVFSTWWRTAPEPVFATAYGCMATLVLLFIPTKYAPFIYFQF